MSQTELRRSPTRILRVLGTLAALGLLVYLLSQQGWEEILGSIQRISVGRFLIVLALASASRLAVAARWSSLLLLSGVKIGLGHILRITYAGLFASNFLPTSVGGDIVRLAGVVRLDSDRTKYASSIAVDRLVGLFGMAMLLPVGLVQVMRGPGMESIFGGVLPGLVPLAGAAVASSWPKELWAKIGRAYRGTIEIVAAWLSAPKALLASLGFTWIHMLFKFSAIRLLFHGLGEELTFWQIAGLWSFVYFISLFPVSINSLGLMEVSTGLVYSTLAGAAVTSALTVALVMRTADMLASLPGAVLISGVVDSAGGKAAPAMSDESRG